MTFHELYDSEHPDTPLNSFMVVPCPHKYGYEEKNPKMCRKMIDCKACWEREVPSAPKLYWMKNDFNKALTNNTEGALRDDLLKEWQKRLGLSEWRIYLADNCRPDEMTVQDVAGCTEWSEAIKSARIEIINPKYYGERIVPFDWEKTLVHELLHLKTCLVSDMVDDLQARYMHQMIDDLARAFVDAKRSGSHK